jgi:hypothetical protein
MALTAAGHARTIEPDRSHEGVAMTGTKDAPELGRWQRRVLRGTLPGGVLLLVAWLVWLALPAVVGETRTDFTFPQGIFGLVTALIMIVTGYGYRRDLAARDRVAATHVAGRPHPFVAAQDSGLAAVASGGGFSRASGGQVDVVATTNRYQRMDGCAVPGCGKPASAAIHAPAER